MICYFTTAQRRAALVMAPLLTAARLLTAQDAPDAPLREPVVAGVAFNVSQPRGAFHATTGLGWGVSGNVLFRLDQNAILNWRADAAFQNYGNVRQALPLSPTTGNLIYADLSTSNNILTFVTGPQLLGPSGRITPYATALGGFSTFWSWSSVDGNTNAEAYASIANSSDFAWTYGGATGVYIRVRGGPRPIHMDVGVRHLRHDDVQYLTTEEVRESVQSRREPRPIRSRVDFSTFFIGVQATVF